MQETISKQNPYLIEQFSNPILKETLFRELFDSKAFESPIPSFNLAPFFATSHITNKLHASRMRISKNLPHLIAVFSLALFAYLHASPTWDQFQNARSEGTEPILPDYSYAGYALSETSIQLATHKVFHVVDYGAVPNDGLDDRPALEAAIAAAEANGSGIIYFAPGQFDLSETPDSSTTIQIYSDDIILRGAGSGPNGTTLFMKEHFVPLNPSQGWTTPSLISFDLHPDKNKRPKLTDITADSSRESFTITVADSASLAVGSYVILEMQNTAANDLFFDGLTPWSIWTKTINDGVQVRGEKHRIIEITDNQVTFAEPIHCDIMAAHGWKVNKAPMATGWGIEDIHFKGNFQETFVHHLNNIHDYGYSMVSMGRGLFPYIRRCRFSDVTNAATLSASYGGTILNCSIEGNQGHSSFSSNYFSYGTLIAYCQDLVTEGAFHGIAANAGSVGTVIYRCKNSNRGFDWHASFPYCTLIDASMGGLIGNGGNVSNPPNHMHNLTFWNFEQTAGPAYQEYDWWSARVGSENYSGAKVAMPLIIGYHGISTTFKAEHTKLIESHGTPVTPESLFESQLELRLNQVPEWIADAAQQNLFFESNGYYQALTNHVERLTFEEWVATHFTVPEQADADTSGLQADPDFDGNRNYLEYYTGTNPKSGNEPIIASMENDSATRIQYSRSKKTRDVSAEVLWSTDLQLWSNESIVETIKEDQGDKEMVQATLSNESDSDRIFFKLRVEAESP